MLQVKDLKISFGEKEVVSGISFSLARGEILALVGESGSGKTVSSLSLTKLVEGASVEGEVLLDDENLTTMPEKKLRHIRGGKIGYIFQEPMSSLNPLHSISKQIAEVLIVHKKLSKKQIANRVIELLEMVGFPDAKDRLNALPHELSGGQRQRVMIAMALANEPEILVADEPTTALDVTIQKQIIDLLKDLQKKLNLAVLFITHDLGLVKAIANKIAVMKNGEIVEMGRADDVIKNPKHDYTKLLISSYNTGFYHKQKPDRAYMIEAENITIEYPISKTETFVAVDDANFRLKQGYTLGIVGESGSGKTSLAMALLHLIKFSGKTYFNGRDISDYSTKELRPFRKNIQIVFQDPFASLNPRMTVSQILLEGLNIHYKYLDKHQKRQEIVDTLNIVGLDGENDYYKYPFEFSGGQRQRIAIARAIILKPDLIVLDEPTSSLDMSLRSQIIDLLKEIQEKYQTSYIFISHDMNTIKAICDDVIVMKDGKIVEKQKNPAIFETPQNEYTKNLIASSFGFNL